MVALLLLVVMMGCGSEKDGSDQHAVDAEVGAETDETSDVTVPDSAGDDAAQHELPPCCCDHPFFLPWFGERLCSMDTGEMEMWIGCPFLGSLAAPPDERLFLGGDPERKWGLPKGAQCAVGFECLPPVNPVLAQVCDFQPTAFGVLPLLVYEPVVYNGQYLMAGADQGKNADPSAVVALNQARFFPSEWGIEWFPDFSGLKYFPPCPPEHLTVPLEEARALWKGATGPLLPPNETVLTTEPRFPPCTSKESWVPPKREMLAQWGPFVQYVIFENFKGMKSCNIAVKTYACGPVLMFTEEDFDFVQALNASDVCGGVSEKHSPVPITRTIVSKSMMEAGLDDLPPIYDWCKVSGNSCRQAGVCEYCYGTACDDQAWYQRCFPDYYPPVEPFCLGNEESGEGVPRPGSFSLFPVPGYSMVWNGEENAHDFDLLLCECDPSGDGSLSGCTKPEEYFYQPRRFRYISPEKQFERIPEFLDGCSDRLLSPPMSL